jgi:hypothetical protein
MRTIRKKKNDFVNDLARDIALYGDPSALSLGGPIIPYRPVHAATVIPKSHVVQRPAKSDLVFDALYVFP